MRRVPFHFLYGLPGVPALFSIPWLMPGGLRGGWVLMAPVRRFCLYGARSELHAQATTCSPHSPRPCCWRRPPGRRRRSRRASVFTPRSGSVNEGARAGANAEHPLLTVTVRVWNLPAGPVGQDAGGQPTARQQAIDALGEITIETEGIGRREAATISPAVRHARGPRRRRGIRRERYLPADRRPRAGRRLAERRVLPAAAVDRVHQYRRPLPGHGHRRRSAGDGHVQPHRHQGLRGQRGAAQRPRRRPGGRELSHAGGQPEHCPESYSRRRGRR